MRPSSLNSKKLTAKKSRLKFCELPIQCGSIATDSIVTKFQ